MRIAIVLVLLFARVAHAQPEPSGGHPRILLDDDLRKAWKELAKDRDSATARAVRRCGEIGGAPKQFARDLYMGLDWAQHLGSCLVAWAATGKDAHAKTALRYFEAFLDDLDNVGDGKGGDVFATRDSGFAIRSTPYVAIAYDWLHDHPGMTDALRAKARKRFAAWTDWYKANGYRARSAGTNYQAGYLIAATFMAIAQGGEAGRVGARLWDHVVQDLWGKDMKGALAPGGVLDGGDWGEGWQYGPLSVAEYALAARVIREHGVEVEGVERWLEALARRTIHATTPGDRMFIGGDTGHDSAHIDPGYLAYAAVLVGDAPAEVKAWIADEVKQLGLSSKEFPFFEALAEAQRVAPKAAPRDQWPTAYLARGIGTFYARSHWGKGAVWMATQCSKTVDVDHFHPNAGNVVVSRGRDDLIVDPSPYGTLSSLTSNAPTVESAVLPEEYKPSQAYWSEKTRYVWARQTTSGIVAARCDYADQYRIQQTPSDVPEAVRDIVLVPYAKGDAAAMVVIDRARSGAKDRELYLRWKSAAALKLDGDVARGKEGSSELTIRRVTSSSGKPQVRTQKKGDCFGAGTTRGGCDIPRFEVDEYKLVVDGPSMYALHVLDVAAPARTAPTATPVSGADGVVLARDGRHAVVVAGTGKDLAYTAPKGDAVYHVIAGAPGKGGKAKVAASAAGDDCKVTVSASGSGVTVDARPVVVVLDAACAVAEDPSLVQPLAATDDGGGGRIGSGDGDGGGDGSDGGGGTGDGTGTGTGPRSARSGCCGAQATPGSSLPAVSLVVLGLLMVLRRRRA